MTTATSSGADFTTAVVQSKPWGHETIFATGGQGYVGKLITVDAGQALSLQYHREKDETICIVSGEATLEHGPSVELLRSVTMRTGDVAHLPPGTLHRLTAVSDVVFAETSSAGPGWREDVVRLADRYGRDGTCAP
jgi:mannose-6-phosphate isomerase-like protein (cupin superfamily)